MVNAYTYSQPGEVKYISSYSHLRFDLKDIFRCVDEINYTFVAGRARVYFFVVNFIVNLAKLIDWSRRKNYVRVIDKHFMYISSPIDITEYIRPPITTRIFIANVIKKKC